VLPVVGPDLRVGETVELVASGFTQTRFAAISRLLVWNLTLGMKWYFVVLTNERVFVLDRKIVDRGGIRQDAILAVAARADARVESYRRRRLRFSRLAITVGGASFAMSLIDEGKRRPGSDIVTALSELAVGVSS